jgi:hypothetical protein
MNVLKKSMLLCGCVAAFTLGSVNHASAQGRFDPAQFKQQRLDSIHEKLAMDDKDWSAIEPLVGKVMDAEFAYRAMEMRGLRGSFGRSRRNREGGDTNGNSSSQRSNRSPFGEPSATAEALQKAVDDKVPASELKAKLAAYRAEIKEKQDALTAAQEELKGVLTSRQEAVMVLNGVLK